MATALHFSTQDAQRRPLDGKVALVTGSSRGIGRGIAQHFARLGASVVVNYVRDEAAARATLESVSASNVRGLLVRADVAQPEQLTGLIEQARTHFGGVDYFVHNALGDLLGFLAPPAATSLEQFDTAFHCQARAFFVGANAAAPVLRDGGRIIALSYWPGAHLGGFQAYFSMGVNKAAIEAMCRYYAVALAPRRITVNAVCAGITDDSIVNALPQPVQDAMLGWLRGGWSPSGRATVPSDVAGAVAALCSDDAAWITGQTIVADGGASLMNPEVPLDFQRP